MAFNKCFDRNLMCNLLVHYLTRQSQRQRQYLSQSMLNKIKIFASIIAEKITDLTDIVSKLQLKPL